MYRGWTKRYRKIEDWQWYKTPHMAFLFEHIVGRANHKDGEWQGHLVKRGQIITGRHSLCEQTGLSSQVIRTCLKRLKSTNEITIQPTNRFSIITVLNYEKYQGEDSIDNQPTLTPANTQLTSNQPATNQQLTTNKNVKNVKNIKNEKNDIIILQAGKNILDQKDVEKKTKKPRTLSDGDKVIKYLGDKLGHYLDGNYGYNAKIAKELVDKIKVNNPTAYLEEIYSTIDIGLKDEWWGPKLNKIQFLLNNYYNIKNLAKSAQYNQYLESPPGKYDNIPVIKAY